MQRTQDGEDFTMSQYFGKYRGTVMNNADPMQIGRLLLDVPDVLGLSTSSWAMPCVPFAGVQSGFYAMPAIGDSVWVEFEGGNRDLPIWVGGFWTSAAQVPAFALNSAQNGQVVGMQTTGQNEFVLSDGTGPAGGVLLRAAGGAVISVNDTGITLSNGKGASIVLTGPNVVVNQRPL
jgi:uncharacterized protein involved in type VI secretion and phage assembly